MPCRPMSVSLEVQPKPTQKIVFGLDKTCNASDEATWKLNFDLQEGDPLASIIKLDVEIDPENHPQAEATAAHGLDEDQRSAAGVAAAIAKDKTATEEDKKQAAQDVIAARQMEARV